MRKYETGAQIKLPLATIDYSLFYEHQTDIPSFTSTITPFSYNSYEIFFYNAGSKPTLDHINVDKLIARQTYLAPTDDKELIRKGVDFTLASKKIWANKGPKFILSGAYFNTIINNSNLKYDISSQERSENKDKLIGIYQSEGHDTDYFLTSLTCTQHIPSLKFIASLTIQNRWINKIVYRKLSTLPIGYMNNLGETYWFTPTDDIKNKFSYLIRDYSTISSNSTEKPSFTNVTLRLTKEISKSLVFSFYINNFFMHNPAWIDRQDLSISKGNPELYFSGEIKIKL